MDEAPEGTTVMLTIEEVPLFSVPRSQVTVPDAFAQPAEADEKAAPAGSVSVMATSPAEAGPRFWAVREYVNGTPASAGLHGAVIVSFRSAPLPATVVTHVWLFPELRS
jgi:hypothetical protein